MHRCFETKEKLSPFFESAYIVASEAAWIDRANANVHKGTTVEHLQRLLNVTPEFPKGQMSKPPSIGYQL